MAQQSASPTPLPLPPGTQDPNVQNAVPDVNRSPGERVLGGIGGLLNVGTGEDFASTPIGQSIARHHQTRLADARRHYEAAQSLATALGDGGIDPATGEAYGIDPATQQRMAPETRQLYKDQLEGAKTDYAKVAGVNPDAKKMVDAHHSVFDFLASKGHSALQQLVGAHQQAQQAAGQPKGSLPPPPPSATGVPNAGAPGPNDDQNFTPSGGLPGLPPPPSANPQQASGAAAAPQAPVQPAAPRPSVSSFDTELTQPAFRENLAAGRAARNAAYAKRLESGAQVQGEIDAFQRWRQTNPGASTTDYLAARGKIPLASYIAPKNYTDLDTGETFAAPLTGLTQDGLVDVNGSAHRNFRVETSGEVTRSTSPAKVNVVNGVPASVTMGGQTYVPASPDWAKHPELQQAWDQANKSFGQGEAAKIHRESIVAGVRAEAFAKNRLYSVIDKTTGETAMVTSADVHASPERFGAAGITQQLRNRNTLFEEIDSSARIARDSINALPDTAFDAKARAQIAAVLRDTDPHSALSTFMGSELASTLTDEQVQYVTALANLEESAMALRTVGGQGSGSDALRAKISALLPGVGTPSRKYALRQMDLFENEVNQLRKSLPISMGGQGQATPGVAPAAAAPNAKAAPPKSRPTNAADYLKSLGVQ